MMGLFSRRKGASITLAPDGPYRATDTITATVTVDAALDKVSAASVQLGYRNGFRYRWAGRADAALNHDNDSLLLMGQVGTDYGSEKDTEEWVPVLAEQLPVVEGILAAGQHRVQLRLPSWSPGSSKDVVRWEIRLAVERSGRDLETAVPLTVLIGPPDPLPASAELPLIQKTRALASTLDFEIVTERGAYRRGDEVRGVVAVTAPETPDRTASIAGWFQRIQESHPVEKTPGSATDSYVRPMTTFAKEVRFIGGQRQEFPFAMTLPKDVDPTTEAVHSSIDWFVQIKVEFSGATGAIERAERGIVVYTG
ncbi:hypothetical protein [Nocardia asteroides]|uniref:hypothetical protein n=1 Tax=Nocardia asteroides TaxID=1824 RepID=UPI001E2EBB1B|nr:hypothetical protein [Nocardia asteroides]UGT62452.1 hypothetical protein LTT61_03650 [Nocardia asteroides]